MVRFHHRQHNPKLHFERDKRRPHHMPSSDELDQPEGHVNAAELVSFEEASSCDGLVTSSKHLAAAMGDAQD